MDAPFCHAPEWLSNEKASRTSGQMPTPVFFPPVIEPKERGFKLGGVGTRLAELVATMMETAMEGNAGMQQQTIGRMVSCKGIGLHSGAPVSIRFRPAPANSGIRFLRRTDGREAWVAARIGQVSGTTLATTLGRGDEVVHTVEHLLAALSGMRIDNVIIELDGPEIPIMDGSARPFVEVLLEAGLVRQAAVRAVFVLDAPFEVRDDTGWIAAAPASRLEIHNTVEYDHPSVGRQVFEYIDEGPAEFAASLAGARTFGFLDDVERLKASGLIRGGSLENAVVVGPHGVLNAEGLRWSDEFVRHKTLDLLGDLALFGGAVRGRITAYKAGHALHAKFTSYLAAHAELWSLESPESRELIAVGEAGQSS